MSALSLPLAVAGAAGTVSAAAQVRAATEDAAAAGAVVVPGHPAAATAAVAAPASASAEAPAAQPRSAAEAFATRAQQTAPVAGIAQPATQAAPSPATAGTLGGAVFALVLVVGLILLLSWLAKRMPGLGGGGAANPALRIVGSLALGPRDRLVVVEVGDTQLLLGVGSGGTRTLHTLEQPLPEAAAKSTPAFAQLLAQHFGKKP